LLTPSLGAPAVRYVFGEYLLVVHPVNFSSNPGVLKANVSDVVAESLLLCCAAVRRIGGLARGQKYSPSAV